MSELVPYCIYKEPEGEGGDIYLPVKTKDSYICEPKEGLEYVGSFYAINPAFRPVPYGTMLMCQTNSGVDFVYDIFNIDEKCIRIMPWVSNVPNTVALYLGKKGEKIYVSFTPFSESYEQVPYSPVYVIPDGKGEYLFRNRYGMCYPDKTGDMLSKCMLKNLSAPSILDLVKQKRANKKYDIVPYLIFILIVVCMYIIIKKL